MSIAPYFDGSQPCASSDPEAWFPETAYEVENYTALRICQGCPFREPCLTYALERPSLDGIWGGASQTDRHNMRRRMRRAAA